MAGADVSAPAIPPEKPNVKPILLLGAALLLAGGMSLAAADSVELNGITCLPGENLACFLLYQPTLTKPLTFMLGEGESRFGFKLLAVDAPGHRVLVEQCGVKKYVRIGSAPELIVTPAGPKAATAMTNPAATVTKPTAAEEQAVARYLASDEVQRIQAGKPILPGALASAVNNSASSQNSAAGAGNAGQNANAVNSTGGQTANAASDANNLGQNFNAGTGGDLVASVGTSSGSPASAAAPAGQNSYTGEVWYQESLALEQWRAMTAAQVLDGSMTPFPRTPLTPPGTPTQLVGQDVYFASHIPGYKVIGYLDQ